MKKECRDIPIKARTSLANTVHVRHPTPLQTRNCSDQVDGGKLQIYTTTGHDNPIMRGHFPILVNDVWEHAYYLKHESRRAAYLHGWRVVVNWAEASRRYERSDHAAEHSWEEEGGNVLTVEA